MKKIQFFILTILFVFSSAIELSTEHTSSVDVLDKSRTWVPSLNSVTTKNKNGYINITFERNSGRPLVYYGELSQANHFVPLVCTYLKQKDAALTFNGCYNYIDDQYQLDPRFVLDSEVYFASKISLISNQKSEVDVTIDSSYAYFPKANLAQTNALLTSSDASLFTPQALALRRYTTGITDMDYYRFYYDFAEDILFTVELFGTFEGRLGAWLYQMLGNYLITDMYKINNLEELTISQSGHVVDAMTKFNISWLNVPENLVEWHNPVRMHVEFNRYNEIASIRWLQDLIGPKSRLTDFIESNVTKICVDIQHSCYGDYQQYSSLQECIDYLSPMPISATEGSISPMGKNRSCYKFHEKLAKTAPEVHCMHCGKMRTNLLETPCQDF